MAAGVLRSGGRSGQTELQSWHRITRQRTQEPTGCTGRAVAEKPRRRVERLQTKQQTQYQPKNALQVREEIRTRCEAFAGLQFASGITGHPSSDAIAANSCHGYFPVVRASLLRQALLAMRTVCWRQSCGSRFAGCGSWWRTVSPVCGDTALALASCNCLRKQSMSDCWEADIGPLLSSNVSDLQES